MGIVYRHSEGNSIAGGCVLFHKISPPAGWPGGFDVGGIYHPTGSSMASAFSNSFRASSPSMPSSIQDSAGSGSAGGSAGGSSAVRSGSDSGSDCGVDSDGGELLSGSDPTRNRRDPGPRLPIERRRQPRRTQPRNHRRGRLCRNRTGQSWIGLSGKAASFLWQLLLSYSGRYYIGPL